MVSGFRFMVYGFLFLLMRILSAERRLLLCKKFRIRLNKNKLKPGITRKNMTFIKTYVIQSTFTNQSRQGLSKKYSILLPIC